MDQKRSEVDLVYLGIHISMTSVMEYQYLGIQKLVVYIFVSGTGSTIAIGRLSALNNRIIVDIFFDGLRGTVARGGCSLKISGRCGSLIDGRPGAGNLGVSGLG